MRNRLIQLATMAGLFLTLAHPALGACCPGDADRNGFVNFSDFSAVQQAFGAPADPSGYGDANCDGFINFADFGSVQENFGTTCLVPPENLTAVPLSSSEIQLEWDDPNPDGTGFVVERCEATDTEDCQTDAGFTEIFRLDPIQ